MEYGNQHTLNMAIIAAVKLHGDQVDKGGAPYIFHPLSVMMRVAARSESWALRMAAVLHDVVEDCGGTVAEIREQFGPEVSEVVDVLTRRESDTDYMTYVRRVGRDADATVVKIADLEENLRPDRTHPDQDKKRAIYSRALVYLQECRREREQVEW